MILCVLLVYDNLFIIYKMHWCMISNTETFSSHHLTDLASSHQTCWYWIVLYCTVLYCIAGRRHCSSDRDATLQRRCPLAAIWCRSSKVHFISVQDLNNHPIAPLIAIAMHHTTLHCSDSRPPKSRTFGHIDEEQLIMRYIVSR
jgi:hypothetical protein